MNTSTSLIRRSLNAWVTNDLDAPGPAWLQWCWTLAFGLLCGAVFTVIGISGAAGRTQGAWTDPDLWWRWYRVNAAISLCIAVLIHLLFMAAIAAVGRPRIRRFTNAQRAWFFSTIPIVGVLLGWPLGVWSVGPQGAGWIKLTAPSLMASAALGAVISFAIYLVFDARTRQALAEKRAAQAQLQLLQAQMEPHFLFNTLANVLTLIESQPARARIMLESFTDYLRASLEGMREGESRVGRELDLAQAYLQLLQLRMEDRLRFEITAEPDVRGLSLPPLMLQPLVENAIQHGLEPQVHGGRVVIQVRRDGDTLELVVDDDGHGPAAGPGASKPGHGLALANIRERLRTLYGDAASLKVEARLPGTRATLRLPIEMEEERSSL